MPKKTLDMIKLYFPEEKILLLKIAKCEEK